MKSAERAKPYCRVTGAIWGEERRMTGTIEVRVSCYAGYRGEESPRSFLIKERKIEVVELLDSWLAPDHRYFKVRGDDRGVYILRHEVATEQWQLTMYERRSGEEG
jgi:hypothetical protein